MGLTYQIKTNIAPNITSNTKDVKVKGQRNINKANVRLSNNTHYGLLSHSTSACNSATTEFYIEQIQLPAEFSGHAQRQILNLVQRILAQEPIAQQGAVGAKYIEVAKSLAAQILQQKTAKRLTDHGT